MPFVLSEFFLSLHFLHLAPLHGLTVEQGGFFIKLFVFVVGIQEMPPNSLFVPFSDQGDHTAAPARSRESSSESPSFHAVVHQLVYGKVELYSNGGRYELL